MIFKPKRLNFIAIQMSCVPRILHVTATEQQPKNFIAIACSGDHTC
jgi:hypothetical protein